MYRMCKCRTRAVCRQLEERVQVAGKYGKNNRETSFTAKGVSKEGANRYMFAYTDKASGKQTHMSVAAYFTNILGIQLQFPALQCVTVHPLPSHPLTALVNMLRRFLFRPFQLYFKANAICSRSGSLHHGFRVLSGCKSGAAVFVDM